MGWPTLTEVKAWLNITTTTDDEWLTHKMAVAIRNIERYTNRVFPLGSYTEIMQMADCRGPATSEMFLKAQPVIKITSVSGLSEWSLSDHGSICLPWGCWSETVSGPITVVYEGGFDPVPVDVLDVFYNMMNAAHSAKGVVVSSGRVKSQTVPGVLSTTYFDDAAGGAASAISPDLPGYYSPILDSYIIKTV